MKAKSQINLVGRVSFKVYENGRLIREYESKNTVVVNGRKALTELLAGNVGTTPNGNWITEFGVGENNATVTDADTALTNPFTKTFDSLTTATPVDGSLTIAFSLGTTEANGMAIEEFGLFTEAGDLFARFLTGGTINKTSSIQVAGTWVINF